MRILIVKTSSMGDVVHNLPIIADICNHFPHAKIDWVVEESFADIVKLHPQVNRVIPIAFRRWKKKLFTKSTWHEIANALHNLKSTHYDIIIDTQGLLKSALIGLCANGSLYGRDWQSNREAFASVFYQHRLRVPFNQHAVNRGRQLCSLALDYALPQSPPNYGLQKEMLASNSNRLNLPSCYVMCLHATSRDFKLWPVENWISIGQSLQKQSLALVLPWANAAEFVRANAIADKVPNALVLPKLDLSALAVITAGAQAAVGVDTGLVHLAVALNVPTIAIYIDSKPDMNGALAGKSSAAINLIMPSVDTVLSTFQQLNIT